MTTKDEMISKVNGVIDQVRPYLEADGGSISFVELTEENIVKVELHGACRSCPMSLMTLKNGVEVAMIKMQPNSLHVQMLMEG